MIASVVATLATKAPSKEVTDIFDMASAPVFGELAIAKQKSGLTAGLLLCTDRLMDGLNVSMHPTVGLTQ